MGRAYMTHIYRPQKNRLFLTGSQNHRRNRRKKKASVSFAVVLLFAGFFWGQKLVFSPNTSSVSLHTPPSPSGEQTYVLKGKGTECLITNNQENLLPVFSFVYPLEEEGGITSGYGERISPIDGKEEFHPAVDIAAPHGSPFWRYRRAWWKKWGSAIFMGTM